jgi:outer membrane protein assembly factor BamB
MFARARCRAGAWFALGLTVVIGLAGCARDKPTPAALEPVKAEIAGRQVWQFKLPGVSFPLALTVREGRVHAAGDDGTVVALDLASGRVLWRAQAGAPLSAGVGSDGRHSAVVTRGNDLVVFDEGRPAWRSRLGSRVVTSPLVAGERIFVLGVDRSVQAFDALDGRRLWSLQRPGDALTLAQAGVLQAFGDTLLVGQGPRLAALDPLRGNVRWEVAVASPRGTNEVERLADLVGPAARVGPAVCLRAFQAAVGCVDVTRGTLQWVRNFAGAQAVAAADDVLVAADATDRISAWRQSTGQLVWTSEKFVFRELSGITAAGSAVVFGDLEGRVHFLDRQDGRSVLRLATDGSAVATTPVLSGTTLLLATRAGGVFAFRPE